MKKLSGDAKLAFDKVSSLSRKLDETEKQLEASEKEVVSLKEDLSSKKIRLEISENLLMEFLKQLQRKINARKEVGIQANVINRRNAQAALKDQKSFLLPSLRR
jgi:regulator of replication initiation timing